MHFTSGTGLSTHLYQVCTQLYTVYNDPLTSHRNMLRIIVTVSSLMQDFNHLRRHISSLLTTQWKLNTLIYCLFSNYQVTMTSSYRLYCKSVTVYLVSSLLKAIHLTAESSSDKIYSQRIFGRIYYYNENRFDITSRLTTQRMLSQQ